MQKGIESLASQLSRPLLNLLLNSDILNILAIINAFALEKLIKQINIKLFTKSTCLLRTDLLNSYVSLTELIHSL